ncbi:MAG: hypothetical protein HZA91_02930 [Verrucomicrobia bacterium]|nr:hypothetical protein [Verrucomicrobiota bacterium]
MNRAAQADEPFDARRHQRAMRWVFVAFAMSVIVMWIAALVVDASASQRRGIEAGRDREMMAIIFGLGVLHVLLSAGVRMFAQKQWAKAAGRAAAANIAVSTTVIALALCEAPTLFGFVFVLLGGDLLPANFFFTFSLTAMAAHYVARLRVE